MAPPAHAAHGMPAHVTGMHQRWWSASIRPDSGSCTQQQSSCHINGRLSAWQGSVYCMSTGQPVRMSSQAEAAKVGDRRYLSHRKVQIYQYNFAGLRYELIDCMLPQKFSHSSSSVGWLLHLDEESEHKDMTYEQGYAGKQLKLAYMGSPFSGMEKPQSWPEFAAKASAGCRAPVDSRDCRYPVKGKSPADTMTQSRAQALSPHPPPAGPLVTQLPTPRLSLVDCAYAYRACCQMAAEGHS